MGGEMELFEPKEWSMLRSVVYRMQPYMLNALTPVFVLNLITELTLMRRRLSVSTSVIDLISDSWDDDSLKIVGVTNKHLRRSVDYLVNASVIFRDNIDVNYYKFMVNVNGILSNYIKLKVIEGFEMQKYLNLYNKSISVFPQGSDSLLIHGRKAGELHTIEDAIEYGMKKKREKIIQEKVKGNESALELMKNIVSIVKSHDIAMPPLTGIKHFSMLKRFMKDCAELSMNPYETIEYICNHMTELMGYTDSRGIVQLYRDFFDFEKIYYNRKPILRWVYLTDKYGPDYLETDQEAEHTNVIELPKKRGK